MLLWLIYLGLLTFIIQCYFYYVKNKTCSFQSLDCLHLPEDCRECVGNDGDHDQDGEQKDQGSGQDQLHVLNIILVCECSCIDLVLYLPSDGSVRVLLERNLTATTAYTHGRIGRVKRVKRALGGKNLLKILTKSQLRQVY